MTASTIAAMTMNAVIAMVPAGPRQRRLHMAADAAEEAAAVEETADRTCYKTYIVANYHFRRSQPAGR